MALRWLCQTCELAAGDCQCDGPTFRFRAVDHQAALLLAARDLCDALVANGFGETSDRALPGEYDTLRQAVGRAALAAGLPA